MSTVAIKFAHYVDRWERRKSREEKRFVMWNVDWAPSNYLHFHHTNLKTDEESQPESQVRYLLLFYLEKNKRWPTAWREKSRATRDMEKNLFKSET